MSHSATRLMLDRLNTFGSDSDSALFHELLYAGEFLIKLTTAAFIAAIDDDSENHRYRLEHGLVRANGLGEWVQALDDTLSGPASQPLAPSFRPNRNSLTSLHSEDDWQYVAVSHNLMALALLMDSPPSIPPKLNLRRWFSSFVELRNKTRGHGAPTPATCARLAHHLKLSITIMYRHLFVVELPWAYLHRNKSEKYQVISLTPAASAFDHLKTSSATSGPQYADGVYIYTDRPRPVNLIVSDLDARDFFFPNGDLKHFTFELHSLISDSRSRADAQPFLLPVGDRPSSESEGKPGLDQLGHALTNIPNAPAGYVRRSSLESELYNVLSDDRHPVITLTGRGGIGKTSLVLHLLHELCQEDKYDLIVWFSARDIDLTLTGPKLVRPHLLTERDLDSEYRTLVGAPSGGKDRRMDDADSLALAMRTQPFGRALYVFDNFETVRDPVGLYRWLDNNIRLPNKVVITTRFRDFQADYSIRVLGMEREEADLLIQQTVRSLGIEQRVTREYSDTVFEQSDGHPYIIKILLGEMANQGVLTKPEKIIARRENILEALFERTYQNLTPIAVRILLTLSRWRSLVPQLAAEVMLLRHDYDGERIDPEAAIDQLVRMSLVERIEGEDGIEFLRVPLTAALFCKKKLDVSPEHALIEEDFRFLNDFGATSVRTRSPDFRGRMAAFLSKAARKLSEGSADIDSVRRVIEFFGRSYPPVWLLMSELEEEVSDPARAAECVRRFLEAEPAGQEAGRAWRRLALLYQRAGDVSGACSAFLKSTSFLDPRLEDISRVANLVNGAAEMRDKLDREQRRTLLEPLARLMEQYIEYASATDMSRLAWLHLHCADQERALEVTRLALEREPSNVHCLRLYERLSAGLS